MSISVINLIDTQNYIHMIMIAQMQEKFIMLLFMEWELENELLPLPDKNLWSILVLHL